eukprot:TRINITY_DN27309_c0_g1_i1.p1 TRINITY_DN27309_c0_g1~~TRINITY_DN27309_c0_g1_i1.p1  ORF type:complete len:1135 (+),score=253.63 TRINITY_DN27309_c0_g1_i1:175-3579(+)
MLWQHLEGPSLPDGFPRQPAALTVIRLGDATSGAENQASGGAVEFLAALGGGPARGAPSDLRGGSCWDLDELCFREGEAPVDIWARQLGAASAAAAVSSSGGAAHGSLTGNKGDKTWSFGGFQEGGSSSSSCRPCSRLQPSDQFTRTVLAFPPRPRCGFSLTALDPAGRRQLLFGGRSGRSHDERTGGGAVKCLSDLYVLEIDKTTTGPAARKGPPPAFTLAPSSAPTTLKKDAGSCLEGIDEFSSLGKPGSAGLIRIAEMRPEVASGDWSDDDSEAEDIFFVENHRAAVKKAAAAAVQVGQQAMAPLQPRSSCNFSGTSSGFGQQAGATGSAGRTSAATASRTLAAAIARQAGRGGAGRTAARSRSSSSASSSNSGGGRSRSPHAAADAGLHASSSASSSGDEDDDEDPMKEVERRRQAAKTASSAWRPSSRAAGGVGGGADESMREFESATTALRRQLGSAAASDQMQQTMQRTFGGFGRGAATGGAGGGGASGKPADVEGFAARWRLPLIVSDEDEIEEAEPFDERGGSSRPGQRPPSRAWGGFDGPLALGASAEAPQAPRARAGHSAAQELLPLDKERGGAGEGGDFGACSVIIYGGLDDGGMPLGDVHRVTISESEDRSLKAQWTCLDDGVGAADSAVDALTAAPWERRDKPRPRACHSAVCWQGGMVVFGGIGLGVDGEARPQGDTWLLDTSASASQQRPLPAAVPGAAARPAAAAAAAVWRRPPLLKGGAPACRWGHAACLVGGCNKSSSAMLLCGGVDGSGHELSDCWLLDLVEMSWERVETQLIASPLRRPVAASWSGAAGGEEAAEDAPALGRCVASWSATEGAAIVWGGSGFLRWKEPEFAAQRRRAAAQERQRQLLDQEVAIAGSPGPPSSEKRRKKDSHKQHRRGKARCGATQLLGEEEADAAKMAAGGPVGPLRRQKLSNALADLLDLQAPEKGQPMGLEPRWCPGMYQTGDNSWDRLLRDGPSLASKLLPGRAERSRHAFPPAPALDRPITPASDVGDANLPEVMVPPRVRHGLSHSQSASVLQHSFPGSGEKASAFDGNMQVLRGCLTRVGSDAALLQPASPWSPSLARGNSDAALRRAAARGGGFDMGGTATELFPASLSLPSLTRTPAASQSLLQR